MPGCVSPILTDQERSHIRELNDQHSKMLNDISSALSVSHEC
jgi:hypothetical protein